jgi:hypothetical protein
MTNLENKLFAALAAVYSTLDEDACSCGSRSWYGDDHDTACPLYYKTDARKAIKAYERKQGARSTR